jgi:peptidoglycan/xylan/chitin deacetylase (PgdA/CDA1 family)
MLDSIKGATLHGLNGTGLMDAVAQSRWRTERLLVLGYHGVSLRDEHLWNPGVHVTLDLFEARMQMLADGGYNVLPLEEGVARLRAGSLPERAVSITFDDGYADFALRAHPVLQRFGFHATLYLTTYYVLFNRPIFNLIVPYMLWSRRDRPCAANPRLGWVKEPDLTSAGGRAIAWGAVNSVANSRALSGAAKDDLAAEVASHLGVDYAATRSERLLSLLTPEEVSEIAKRGVSVELHTHRHRAPLNADLFKGEILDNRRHIQDMTSRHPVHFCYPSGLSRQEMFPLLSQCGIRSAVTCEPRLGSASTNPLSLPRFLDMQTVPDITYLSWLTGTGALLARCTTAS